MDQDKILEQKIRQIAEQVYAQKTLKSKYGVSQVPFHTHNGTDSVRISETNIIHNTRNYTRLLADESTVFSIRNVSNVDKITLKGFVADNADGMPATKRAIVNGEAYFGRCYNFTGVAPDISLTSTATGIPFVQSSNSMYVSGTTARVSVAPSLGYATTGSDIFTLTIISYNNGFITFDLQIAPGQNWLLQVDLILS